MKKNLLQSVVITCLVLGVFSLAMADPVDVAGDCYYFANGDLAVLSLTSGVEIARFGSDDGVFNASDVVVKNGKAVVTTTDQDIKEVVVVDVSTLVGCTLGSAENEADGQCNEDKYLSKYKQGMDVNYLEIPGVDVDGTIYTVTMSQRGNSNNWEVAFVDAVPDISEEEPAAE